jgi:membrane protease YdiL (CAAX protease family)
MKTIYQNLTELIKRHPLEAFFIIAIAIMFGLVFPAIFLIPRENTLGQIIGYYFARIGVYSPVIAGIMVTRVTKTPKNKVPFARRLMFLLPVWLLALGIQMADLKLNASSGITTIGLIILALPVSFLPTWVVSSAVSGPDNVRRMLNTLIKPRGNFVYYLIALLTFPFIQIVGTVITNIIHGQTWFPDVSQVMSLAYTVFITFLSVLFYSGGINEEAGWRGFAQKRFQAKFSPLITVFLLWFLMVIWHMPNDIVQYQNGGYLLVRIAIYPVVTILFSWIFNRTNGSILAVAIFHASMNSMNPLMGIFPVTLASNIMLIIFAITVVLVDRMWHKLPGDHPAAYAENIKT